MILEPFFLHRIGGTVESYCSIRSRQVRRGFERVRLSITGRSFKAIAEEAAKRPHTLRESICAIYPDQPRPVPNDIVEIEVQKDIATKGNILMTVTIKRGHYYPFDKVDLASVSRYDIEEVEDDTKTMEIES